MTTTIQLPVDTLKIAGRDVNLGEVPASSLLALVARGATHYFGNEQASKVSARKAKFKEENDGVEMADDEVEALKSQLVAEAFDRLMAGFMGQRAVGVSIDPLEKAMRKIAKDQVLTILRANNIKPPKKDEAVKFADGTEKTLDAMVDTRLENHGEAIEKEARKAIADAQKRKDAAVAAAKEVKAATAEALGL